MDKTEAPPRNPAGVVLKELWLKNLAIYWNSESEMYIPTSLWESTRHLKYQIFEAMPADSLKEIMTEPFNLEGKKSKYFYLLDPTTLTIHINFRNGTLADLKKKGLNRLSLNVTMSKVHLNVTTHLLKDVKSFGEFVEGYGLSKELRRYKPQSRPITAPRKVGES